MPPKKVEEPEKKPLIGRVGTNLKVGIVGIPNVGKSTFFNVLTKSQAAAENFPFCTIDPNENNATTGPRVMKVIDDENEVRNKNGEITGIRVDSGIVARRSLLPLIRGYYPRRGGWYEPQQNVQPLASVYYSCNAAARIGDFIEETGRRPPHFDAAPIGDPYSEEEARVRYLSSKPVCYVVFGKPGLETDRVAKSIATARNCVLISASRILRELSENDDVQECGCDSREDVAWKIIVDRVGRGDVLHRGYVIEGVPFVENKTAPAGEPTGSSVFSSRSESKVSAQRAKDEYVLVNMRGSASSAETSDSCQTGRQVGESSTPLCSDSEATGGTGTSLSSADTGKLFSAQSTSSSTLSSDTVECACSVESSGDTACSKNHVSFHLNEIFHHWSLKPDVVVSVTCPNDEILAKHEAAASCDSSDEHACNKSDTSDSLSSSSSFNKFCSDVNFNTSASSSKINLAFQLEFYDKYVSESVEKAILNHNPQNVMCVDGRYPVDHSIKTIQIRLRVLPLQIAVSPERVSRATDEFDDSRESEGEESRASDEYESDSLDGDSLVHLRRELDRIKRDGALSDKFECKLSRWKFLCPVELARGRKVEGKRKLAVRFVSWIFFLSSSEAVELFIENPRPYLLPPNPRPTCRIAVIGPRYSGKTDLSFDLAMRLDSVVVDVHEVIASLNVHDEKCAEVVTAIAETVENLPEESCGDFARSKGWILDSIDLDHAFCKDLLENDVNIETAVILFESEPYGKLIDRWHKIFDEDEEAKSGSCESYGEADALCQYVEEVSRFNESRKKVANLLASIGVDVMLCDIKYIDDVSDHVVSQICKEYGFEAEVVEAEDEREDEKDGSEEDNGSSVTMVGDKEVDFYFGDCKNYCPVALMKHNVLLKGKMDYQCLLDGKIYFLSSESAQDDFMANHAKLQLPLEKPIEAIPPLRVFLVGSPGSGKTKLADRVAKNYGLIHVDFFKLFEELMASVAIDVPRLKRQLALADEEESGSSSDFCDAVELPEDPDDPRYISDKYVLSKLYLKYKTEGAVLPKVIAHELVVKFFKPPFDNCGLIIDSFPNCPEDYELILKNCTFPDVVIDLKCDLDASLARLLVKSLADWKIEQHSLREAEEARFSEAMDNYLEQKNAWMDRELMKRYKEKKQDAHEFEAQSAAESFSSDFSSLSDFSLFINTDDEVKVEEAFSSLFPKPEPFEDWESEESARERFSMQTENEFERVTQNLFHLCNLLQREPLSWIEVDAKLQFDRVLSKLLYLLKPYAQRNLSFFETVHEVDTATAENLLSMGHYFLSSFGRFCPVQLYSRENLFQMFLPLAGQGQILPVLHRQFVYFVGGRQALAEFKSDPLKYLNQDPRCPALPALISIIGPPKCGKTSLSRRFASTYGFEAITRDEAIHYALDNFPWISLSAELKKTYQDGEAATPQQLASAVKLFLWNFQCATQGCVFDGFPSGIEEARAFASMAMNPLVYVDLEAPLHFTLECLAKDEERVSDDSHYYYYDYDQWKTDAEQFRTWIEGSTANVARIDATRSRAAVWRVADRIVRHRFASFVTYVREAGYDKVYDLEFISVTPTEIRARSSRFRLYCPSCACFDEVYRTTEVGKTRRGLVQYGEYFYWFCESHLAMFKRDASRLTRAFERVDLPEDFPQAIEDVVDLDNRCWSCRLTNGGYCVVTYVDGLPDRKLALGKPDLAVLFRDQVYLFCSEACREKFNLKFAKYSSLKIHLPQTLDPVELRDLPGLGFLEQSVARFVVKAAHRVAELRPKLLGLSSAASAAIFLGAHLKANYASNPTEARLYGEALRRMELRCDAVKQACEAMTRMRNPYLGAIEDVAKSAKDSRVKKAKSVVDVYEGAGVKFRRTSATQQMAELEYSD